jgi:hypothetical protein
MVIRHAALLGMEPGRDGNAVREAIAGCTNPSNSDAINPMHWPDALGSKGRRPSPQTRGVARFFSCVSPVLRHWKCRKRHDRRRGKRRVGMRVDFRSGFRWARRGGAW